MAQKALFTLGALRVVGQKTVTENASKLVTQAHTRRTSRARRLPQRKGRTPPTRDPVTYYPSHDQVRAGGPGGGSGVRRKSGVTGASWCWKGVQGQGVRGSGGPGWAWGACTMTTATTMKRTRVHKAVPASAALGIRSKTFHTVCAGIAAWPLVF